MVQYEHKRIKEAKKSQAYSVWSLSSSDLADIRSIGDMAAISGGEDILGPGSGATSSLKNVGWACNAILHEFGNGLDGHAFGVRDAAKGDLWRSFSVDIGPLPLVPRSHKLS